VTKTLSKRYYYYDKIILTSLQNSITSALSVRVPRCQKLQMMALPSPAQVLCQTG